MNAAKASREQIEELRRRIAGEHERGLPSAVEGDEVLAVIYAYDQAQAEREQLLDALRAVHEALDIPYAATVGGEETRGPILSHRTLHAIIALRGLVVSPRLMGWEIARLRENLAEHPPTGYLTYEQAQALVAEGRSWVEAVTPPEPDASPAADASTPSPPADSDPAPGGPDRGGWGADVPAAESAAALRRAAGLIELKAYQNVDVVGAITQAASDTRALSATASDLAHAAAKDLTAHLVYDTSRDSRRDLARWARSRTREQIVAELLAAAHGLDGSPRAASNATLPDQKDIT